MKKGGSKEVRRAEEARKRTEGRGKKETRIR